MTTARIRSAGVTPLSGDREPPREFKLWDFGENPTDYGVHVWNERSIREVLARYNERGNPLLLDVEHNGTTLKDGEPSPIAGYARLEVRADNAPWLVCEWSDFGADQIRTGQRRFASAEYDVDKNTGEILALYRVSLVADPGTHRARMLAAALTQEKPMDLSVILAALRAALAAEDPAVAKESISNLLAELEKTAGGDAPADAPSDAPSETPFEAASEDDGMKKDEDKDKMAAKAAPKPATKAESSVETKAVSAAAAAAVAQIKAAQRDHLIETQGDRLEPSIRRWASAQPLEVVQGLLDATPAKDVAKTRAKATQGAGGEHGLSERELQKCKARGIDPAKYAAVKAASGGN